MSLAILATEENWQAFDEAWAALVAAAGPIDELCAALEIVGSKRRISRCMPSVREHAEKLSAAGRPAEAAQILGATLRSGGPVGELVDPLLRHANAAWGAEPWWTPFLELAGLKREAPDFRKAWIYFDDMRSYAVGTVVFHAAGWGVGEVKEVSHANMEIQVVFHSGRKDRFPLRTAVEIFERLPLHDLRSQVLRDPQGLKKRLKDEPLEILKAVLLRYGGKASNVTVRNALMQIGVDGNSWSTWWKKTRLAAENDPMYRVSGNVAKCEIELLRRAIDPKEALRRQLTLAKSLKDALSRVRDILGGEKLQKEIRDAALEEIDRLAAEATQPLDQRISAWMLLREHRKETPPALTERLVAAAAKPAPADPSVAPELWAFLQRIQGAREQEKSVELLPETHGEAWVEEAVKHLAHASPGMVKPLIDALRKAGRDADLARWYVVLLARPTRAAFVLTELARLAEGGQLQGEFPTPVQRAMALIELAVYLQEMRRGNAVMTRAQSRLTDLMLDGEPPLVHRMLAGADIGALRTIRGMLQRGVDEKLDSLITDIVIDMGGDVFKAEQLPFWAEAKVWTTRAGLEKRDKELREIKEKKLPANAEAIAKAAAFGDLSENAEWEQAIEEQRQLTNAATEIDKELRMAALLENANIPDNTVAPGTIVTYRDRASSEAHTVTILGPWDSKDDHTISYKAPLARGMLGRRKGDKATIELPGGTQEVEILTIQLAPLA
jgi:transcription elongation factor GreA